MFIFRYRFILPVAVLAACIGCKESLTDDTAVKDVSGTVSGTNGTVAPPVDYQRVYDQITAALDSMTADADTTAKRSIVAMAWDSIAGGFYCPGRATGSATLPAAARKEAALRAAQLVARRWALLFREWRAGNFHTDDTSIKGEVSYDAVVLETYSGDTAHLLVQVPLGSIMIQ